MAWNVATTSSVVSHVQCPNKLIYEPSWVCIRPPCASRAVKFLIYLDVNVRENSTKEKDEATKRSNRKFIESKFMLQ